MCRPSAAVSGLLELGHGIESEFEHVAGEVQLAAFDQLPSNDLEQAGLDHPTLAMALLEPGIGKQQVKAIDGAGLEHAIEIDVEVDVAKHQVRDRAGPVLDSLVQQLEHGLADLEPDHEPLGVAVGQLERELSVGAAELDLDPLEPGRDRDWLGADLEEVSAERIDMLANPSHERRFLADPGFPDHSGASRRTLVTVAGLARMFGSTGSLLGVLVLSGAGAGAAELPTVELRATLDAGMDSATDQRTHELTFAEDSVVDRPMIAADSAERAHWTMPPMPAGPLPRWIAHRPTPRETIEQIAHRHRVSARHIREWNHLAPDFQPSFERTRPKSLKVWANQLLPARQALEHRVRAGETWVELADRHGVDSQDLRAWNVGQVGRELELGEALTVWIDPIVYQSIVEDPEPDSPVRPGAHGVGSPNRGTLVAGVQIPLGEAWELRYPNSAYGTTFAIRHLLAALDEFAQTGTTARPIKLGTMSRPRGGQVGHHDSHQTGRDLDIRLPLRESVPASLAPTARRVDWTATWRLIEAFAHTGAVQVIFLDYAMQKRVHRAAKAVGASDETLAKLLQWPRGSASNQALVRHEPGHAQHVHVRFTCGPSEPECID